MIPSILPPLTPEESLETTRIYSSRGLLEAGQSLIVTRPVRMPHHSTSSAALVGGGVIPQPGEISLAHHGVLFLDELPEFSRPTLEMIRQPLEDRCVTIPRVHSTIRFPASIMLVGAMNPCPCGYFTDPKRPCKCSPFTIERYMGRLSGPLIDRIDIHIEVPPVALKDLRSESPRSALDSATMRAQVVKARTIQRERFTKWAKEHPPKGRDEVAPTPSPLGGACPEGAGEGYAPHTPEPPEAQASMDALTTSASDSSNPSPLGGGRAEGPGEGNPSPLGRGCPEGAGEGYAPHTPEPTNNHTHGSTTTNATMSSRQIRHFCKLDAAGEVLLKQAMTELGLSARAHDKVLRIARTIADLEAIESIQPQHLAEAIQYRRLDRKL